VTVTAVVTTRRAEAHGMHERLLGLRGEAGAQVLILSLIMSILDLAA
jgi:hypothetical protein